jgi:Kef-type K+ transport system membrane component KefB
MAERNTEGGRRVRRGSLGKTVHLLAKGGRYAIHVPLVIAGWLLATAVVATLLWLTVDLEEGLPIAGIAFVYVLRTILGSLLLALVVLPVAYVLPRRWREKARKLSSRQVAIAVVMCIVIVAVFVALEAANAFR